MTGYQAQSLKKILDTMPNFPLDITDTEHWITDRLGDYRCLYMARHFFYAKEGSTTIVGEN